MADDEDPFQTWRAHFTALLQDNRLAEAVEVADRGFDIQRANATDDLLER